MPLPNTQDIVNRLVEFQRELRGVVLRAHRSAGSLSDVSRDSAADTIYRIDADVEPVMLEFFEAWGKTTPLILVAEGLEDAAGNDAVQRVFPSGTREEDAVLRVIVDPIDGTRGLMYDKRSAWSLAGVAPNRGPAATRLRDIEVAVMTELPTSKMGVGDVLWATKGGRARAMRENLRSGERVDLPLRPSSADGIEHGFASVVSFFPGTKALAAELMELLARELTGAVDVGRATVFDDQYISTGGQFYELIAGHDRFIADLRPVFYRMTRQPQGLCCHPYDCATLLIAEEAGVVITDERGAPLDGPMDVTTGLSWVGYANQTLRRKMEPVVARFIAERLTRA
jgi:fructose-1,6-bisphosphatase/inositol monophosphatase family enzyme